LQHRGARRVESAEGQDIEFSEEIDGRARRELFADLVVGPLRRVSAAVVETVGPLVEPVQFRASPGARKAAASGAGSSTKSKEVTSGWLIEGPPERQVLQCQLISFVPRTSWHPAPSFDAILGETTSVFSRAPARKAAATADRK
jgi:hypothetical protein